MLDLEAVYARIHKSGKVKLKDNLNTTRHVTLMHFFSPDSYAIILGLLVISWTTNAFAVVGYDYGAWQPVVVTLAGLLACILPALLLFFIIPFHLFFGVNTWILTAINIVLSAGLFSIIEPVIPAFFYDGGILYFKDLFWRILAFYTFALSFIHMRIRRKLCFNIYVMRQERKSIQQFLPTHKTGSLISLSAQDHYVNIVTESGEHLIRMSMKEAVALMPENEGMRVHRSHWVANRAILSLGKKSGRVFVILQNGTQIPVAKSYVKEIQDIVNTNT